MATLSPALASVATPSPSLPLPTELEQLLLSQSQLQQNLVAVQRRSTRLIELSQARKQGNERMDTPVNLGMGCTIQGDDSVLPGRPPRARSPLSSHSAGAGLVWFDLNQCLQYLQP